MTNSTAIATATATATTALAPSTSATFTDVNRNRVYDNIKSFLTKRNIVVKEGHKKEGRFLYVLSNDKTNARAIEIWVRDRNFYQLFTRDHIRDDSVELFHYYSNYNLQYAYNFKTFEQTITAFLLHYNDINKMNISTEIYPRNTEVKTA